MKWPITEQQYNEIVAAGREMRAALELVELMRTTQKKFFHQRDKFSRQEAIGYERLVDQALAKIKARKPTAITPERPNLFNTN